MVGDVGGHTDRHRIIGAIERAEQPTTLKLQLSLRDECCSAVRCPNSTILLSRLASLGVTRMAHSSTL